VALEVKEGLATQALFPVRRAEAAMQIIIRFSGYAKILKHASAEK